MNSIGYIGHIRRSTLLLITRILLSEVFINSIYFFPRLLKVYLNNMISSDSLFVLNQASIVLYLVVLFVQIVFITYIVLEWSNNTYLIRDNEIIHRRGVFNLKEDTYSLRNVEALTLEQGFIGKIFNFGTIHFYSPVLKQEYYIENVSAPSSIKSFIEENIKNSKNSKKSQMIIPKK